ncbi:MAG: HD domain-containing phosphohydrolase [Burkholderiaceae bacterium]
MDLFVANRPSALIVNDRHLVAPWIPAALREICDLHVADDVDDLLRMVGACCTPKLIVLDTQLPDVDGYAICQKLKSDPVTWHIPVVLLGDPHAGEQAELRGFDCGATDYIQLPVSPQVFLARMKVQLAQHANTDLMRKISDGLEQAVARRTEEMIAVQDFTILVMTSLAQTRDSETGNHIRRTQHYVHALSRKLQSHPRFAALLSDAYIELLLKSAPMHDIGKVGIPDRILLKPDRYEPAEMDIMKTHAVLGRDAIEYAENLLGHRIAFLTVAKEIAYSHHEKWDGSGYPQGLCGEEIPVSARLMALADVYDAVISRRVYKVAMPHERAVDIISQGRGEHFDPAMVDAFMDIAEEFRAIAARFTDSDDDLQKKVDYLALATQATPPGTEAQDLQAIGA